MLRGRLQKLLRRALKAQVGRIPSYRVFTDSAPVMEVELAEKAGLGWRGKHTLLLNREAGSWFFLGEIYTDLPLPVDAPQPDHCGTCSRCIDVCPTQAIVAPYQLDARRCISYLTIEHKGDIPEALRPLIGQPHLRLRRLPAGLSVEPLCAEGRHRRISRCATASMTRRWSSCLPGARTSSNGRLEGSAIRRIGHERWLRNLAVGLGNAPTSPQVVAALRGAARPSIGDGAKACGVGAGTAHHPLPRPLPRGERES